MLSKLEVVALEIEEMVEDLLTPNTVNYSAVEYRRAVQMAKKIGFQHINDCLHTEIAETHCDELYTFNKSDFKKIRRLTDLKITIL